jgi:hypothetical protein
MRDVETLAQMRREGPCRLGRDRDELADANEELDNLDVKRPNGSA